MLSTEIDARVRSLESELDQMRARVEIADVLHMYCRAADRCDEQLMLSCYHEDAIDDHGFYSGAAKDFVPFVIAELQKLTLSVHSISNTLIQRNGETAFVESRYAVVHRVSHWLGHTDFYHHGRYLDVFERRAGEWKIATRVIVQDGERWFQTADLAPFLMRNRNRPQQGTHAGRSDPVYLGPSIREIVQQRSPTADLWRGFRRLAQIPLILIRLASAFSAIAQSGSVDANKRR